MEKITPDFEQKKCPCCNQTVKVYRRKVHVTIARELQRAVEMFGVGRAFHVKELGAGYGGGEFAKLVFWGLIIKPTRGNGRWIVTNKGFQFVKTGLAIPKYAHVYNGAVRSFSEETVTFNDVITRPEIFDKKEI